MDLRVFTEQMFMREKRTRKPDFVWLPAAFLFKRIGPPAEQNASFPPHPSLLTAGFSGTLGFHENIFSIFLENLTTVSRLSAPQMRTLG